MRMAVTIASARSSAALVGGYTPEPLAQKSSLPPSRTGGRSARCGRHVMPWVLQVAWAPAGRFTAWRWLASVGAALSIGRR